MKKFLFGIFIATSLVILVEIFVLYRLDRDKFNDIGNLKIDVVGNDQNNREKGDYFSNLLGDKYDYISNLAEKTSKAGNVYIVYSGKGFIDFAKVNDHIFSFQVLDEDRNKIFSFQFLNQKPDWIYFKGKGVSEVDFLKINKERIKFKIKFNLLNKKFEEVIIN
jgi:hypothetical protein